MMQQHTWEQEAKAESLYRTGAINRDQLAIIYRNIGIYDHDVVATDIDREQFEQSLIATGEY